MLAALMDPVPLVRTIAIQVGFPVNMLIFLSVFINAWLYRVRVEF